MSPPSSPSVRYRMIANKDIDETEVNHTALDDEDISPSKSRLYRIIDRETYYGSLIFNLGAFLLPALYGTLSKLWVADIDSSQVVTTDVYTYIGVIVECLNEGLPRAAWSIIGDKSTRTTTSRLSLTYTLITFQTVFGAILTLIFIASAEKLAGAFVPEVVRSTSLTYVRISSISALSSAMEVAVSSSTRALDHPDVPLLISSTKFVVNIILDMLIISKFHVGHHAATINIQALIRMACDLSSAVFGLGYFIYIALKVQRRLDYTESKPRISWSSLMTLVRPGIWTFIESAQRNAVYLWLISGIVSMGLDYATAWGVFNTIRWGIFMVPVQALETSTLTFVGHEWGKWRAEVGPMLKMPTATKRDLLTITYWAWVSCAITLAVEIPVCIFLSIWGIKPFAYFLSGSEAAAKITQHMWKTIDWCYIFYGLNFQIAGILLATTTRWYLFQGLASNLLWSLPWAIAVTRVGMNEGNAWTYHSIIFGGALVFSFFIVVLGVGIWAWRLMRGKLPLAAVHSTL